MTTYSFLTACELILIVSWLCEHLNSTPKSRAKLRSKMPTTWHPNFFNLFIYWKCCVDRHWFQNIYQLNRRPYLSLLDLKETCTRYARAPTNEADLFDRHDHWTQQSNVQCSILPHIQCVFAVQLFAEQTQKPRHESGCDSPTSLDELAEHELTLQNYKITKHSKQQLNFSSRHCSFTRCYP